MGLGIDLIAHSILVRLTHKPACFLNERALWIDLVTHLSNNPELIHAPGRGMLEQDPKVGLTTFWLPTTSDLVLLIVSTVAS